MQCVATIETDREQRASIYINRESQNGHWVWRVYTREAGDWIDHTGPNMSRDEAMDAIAYLWSSREWDLCYESKAEGRE